MSARAGNGGGSRLQLQVYTTPTRPIGGSGERTFSPTTSTLLLGAAEAVLVDAPFHRDDVAALGDMIEQSGRKLTTIFITHGHADHYFGSGRLSERFPGARIVTTAPVLSHIEKHLERDTKIWASMFGNDVEPPTRSPEPLEGASIWLEGHELKIIPLEQGDISPTAVLYSSDLAAVIAGDVVYNQIHQMMALSGPAEWRKWAESVEAIRHLEPNIVVAGHKKPGANDADVKQMLDGTRDYLADFAEAAGSAADAEALVATMREKYPTHGNLTTLIVSADAALKARGERDA